MRKLLFISLVLAAFTAPAIGAFQNEHHRQRHGDAQPITVKVGDEQVMFPEAQPQTMMGRVMVPVRGIFEKIGAYVEYNPATHVIDMHYRNESIEIVMGKRIANVNGAEILLAVPAAEVNGSALVPLRFLAESMGAKVDFDAPSNTVTITRSDNSFGQGHDRKKGKG